MEHDKDSPLQKLEEIYGLLKGKLEHNQDQFQDAIVSFHRAVFTKNTDDQLSSALAKFGDKGK